MNDWPVREPWFLRGRRSVVQRAVLISAALAVLAMVAAWIASAGCALLFWRPAAGPQYSVLNSALLMGLASSLCMNLPLQVGLRRQTYQIAGAVVGVWIMTTAVFAFCFELENRLIERLGDRISGRFYWATFCTMAYASAFSLWVPRRGVLTWSSSVIATITPTLLAWFLFPFARDLIRTLAPLMMPEFAEAITLACLWGMANMAMLVPWGLPWWQAPPEEATPE